MDNILRLSLSKKAFPISAKPKQYFNNAMSRGACENVVSMLQMYFDLHTTEKTNKEVHRLPSPSSGFHSFEDGIISKIDSTKEKSGIFCQNDAHYGAVENVTINAEYCDPCVEYGAPLKTTHDCWSLQEDLPPIITSEDDLQPKFLLALVSRTSTGCPIPQKVFDELRLFIDEYQREIFEYMLRKTGKPFKIHVVEEFGTNGSILAQMRDCVHHVKDAGNGLHLPASHIKDIFVYYNTQDLDMQFSYVVNHPSDMNGKLANHAQNLMELKEAGIDPEAIHFISRGLQYGKRGVIEDFTIFSGDEMLDQCRQYMNKDSVGIPKSVLPNVHGFLSAMTHDISPRFFRNEGMRKTKAMDESSRKKPRH